MGFFREIVGFNPDVGMEFPFFVLCELYIVSGLCDELVTHSEKSCLVCVRV